MIEIQCEPRRDVIGMPWMLCFWTEDRKRHTKPLYFEEKPSDCLVESLTLEAQELLS